MKEDLISFKTAKLAKEKGFFDRAVSGEIRLSQDNFYNYEGKLFTQKDLFNNTLIGDVNKCINAPTQSLLQKWLWETHKIWVEIYLVIDRKFSFYIKNEDGKIIKTQNEKSKDCKNPYIIFEEGLQEALKLI